MSIPSSASALFEKNRLAFERYFPEIWERLKDIEPNSKIIWSADGAHPINIDVGGVAVYPADAAPWTEGQLKAFAAEPEQLLFSDPTHCNLSAVSLDLYRRLVDFRQQHDIALELSPQSEIGFSIILGIGLGHHLPDLLTNHLVNSFLICEPVPEFILHSMYTIDWGDLVEKIEENNQNIKIIMIEKPEIAVRSLEHMIVNDTNTFIDGSYVYCHYYSWNLKTIYNSFLARIKVFYNSTGFFEDEIDMITHTTENFARWDFRLINRQAYIEEQAPVFIIGSGPSIDNDLDAIRSLQDRAILISCGTALGILLKAGITPDIHCENENVRLVEEIMENISKEHDIHNIKLLCTTTVSPGLSKNFKDRWFYFRTGLSPEKVYAPNGIALRGAAPLVANAAFQAAVRLGFRKAYLFGCDCGMKDPERHHSTSSFYYDDTFKEREQNDNDFARWRDRVLPGNFGGEVHSTFFYDMSRRFLYETARAADTEAYNCSDGAKIDLFTPLDAYSIDLPPLRVSKAVTLRKIESQLEFFSARSYLAPYDFDQMISDGLRIREDLLATLQTKPQSDQPYRVLLFSLLSLFKDHDRHPFVAMSSSSILAMLRLGAFAGLRIADEEKRALYFDYFLQELSERCEHLIEEGQKIVERLRDIASMDYQTLS